MNSHHILPSSSLNKNKSLTLNNENQIKMKKKQSFKTVEESTHHSVFAQVNYIVIILKTFSLNNVMSRNASFKNFLLSLLLRYFLWFF